MLEKRAKISHGRFLPHAINNHHSTRKICTKPNLFSLLHVFGATLPSSGRIVRRERHNAPQRLLTRLYSFVAS
jgi:hypothetical protein